VVLATDWLAPESGMFEQQEAESSPREPVPPAPFTTRLAHFLNCDEGDLHLQARRATWKSKMSYWCGVPLGFYHGPKSAWSIRRILEHIRYLVHDAPIRRR
jgi:hypothetical protein